MQIKLVVVVVVVVVVLINVTDGLRENISGICVIAVGV